jgi:hypothetical protein
MKQLRIYDMLTEDGRSLADITLEVNDDYSWVDIFDAVFTKTGEDIDTYSYLEI